jgi:inhibitor of KinA
MPIPHPYTIFPLGDSALTIDFGNIIDLHTNQKVIGLFHLLKNKAITGIKDIVPAYSSITIYYDVAAFYVKDSEQTAFDNLAEMIEKITEHEEIPLVQGSRNLELPVCYAPKYALDIELIAEHNKMSVEEIIHIHTSNKYRIYMIGFLPGFAYMGEVDQRIAFPRREEPRTKVAAGSVGIAGRQTGIYPFESPGGWQIIGQTPVPLFHKDNKEPVILSPGDEVSFYSITEDEFTHYQSRYS